MKINAATDAALIKGSPERSEDMPRSVAAPLRENSPMTFDEWFDAHGYKYPQCDYASDDHREVAKAAWDAALSGLRPEAIETDAGIKALAIDSIRWMALCDRVNSMDIATVIMGSQTSKSRREGLERLTEPYLPQPENGS